MILFWMIFHTFTSKKLILSILKRNLISFKNINLKIWRFWLEKKKKYTNAVNLYMINWLSKSDLMTAYLNFESDSAYQLKLTLKQDIMNFIWFILNNDFLKNINVIHFSIFDHFADFSVKLKKLQITDISWLDIDDFFFFVWNERNLKSESLLKMYSVDKLYDTDMLAVEMNISSYDFFVRSDSRHAEYSLSLHDVYVFSESISNFSSSAHSLSKNFKCQNDNLVSLRKNKKSD